MRALALFVMLSAASCSKPRHGIITTFAGLGVTVGGLTLAPQLDPPGGESREGAVYGVTYLSLLVGLPMIVGGLTYAIVKDTSSTTQDNPSSRRR